MNSSRCPDLFGNEDMDFGNMTVFQIFLVFETKILKVFNIPELFSLVLTQILIPTQNKQVYRKGRCGLIRELYQWENDNTGGMCDLIGGNITLMNTRKS